jgi:DNA polymerase-3 subunit epsilon
VSIDFVALDVETANRHRGSVCSVGAVRVRDGRVIERFATLVRPPVPGFEPMNVRIHGIREPDVVDAPTWPAVHRTLVDLVRDDVVVAHNASFETSALRQACVASGIPAAPFGVLCTRRLAKAHLVLGDYRLTSVTTHLGLGPFTHHDALQDATAAARIVLALAGIAGVDTTAELVSTPARP